MSRQIMSSKGCSVARPLLYQSMAFGLSNDPLQDIFFSRFVIHFGVDALRYDSVRISHLEWWIMKKNEELIEHTLSECTDSMKPTKVGKIKGMPTLW